MMKFDGNDWVVVGTEGFSDGNTAYINLAFSPAGDPYVAYIDNLYAVGRVTVMKYNGTNWEVVGYPRFTSSASYLNFAFSPSGEPHVSFSDGGSGQKASVLNFDGSNWLYVGPRGFTDGDVFDTDIAFGPSGELYIAFTDEWFDFRASVMKYDSVYVSVNEPLISQPSLYPNPASTTISIETPAKGSLSIINSSGQQILQLETTKQTTIIDVTALLSGIYVVKLVSEKGVQLRKFIKH